MSQVVEVEVSEEGSLYVAPEVLVQLLGSVEPHTRYVLEAQDGSLTLTRVEQEQASDATASPEERAKKFWDWAMSLPEAPALPGETFSRDSIYD